MKKLILWLALLLPGMASAQVNGVIQKTPATKIIRGSFGSSGLDSLLVTNGLGIDGYVPVYKDALKKAVFINPSTFMPTLSGTSPIQYNSGVISILTASGSQNGALSSADWTNFNTAFNWGNHAGLYPTYNGAGATGTWGINITGNAATVTNGVYTTGSYANPSWITSLAYSKLTGAPSLSGFVPYTGATGPVNLGSYNLTVNEVTVGKGAGTGSSNTVLGGSIALSVNTTGFGNTAIGSSSLGSNTTGNSNTAVGVGALGLNSTTSSNTAVGSHALSATIASQNTALGFDAGVANTTGVSNTAIGYYSFITNTTGFFNTVIGAQSDVTTSSLSNATAIGYNAKVDANNKIQLGNTSVTTLAVGQTTFTGTTGVKSLALPAVSGTLALTTDIPTASNYWTTNSTQTGLTGNKTTTGTITAPTFIGALTGNASTATLAANSTLWNGYSNNFGSTEASPDFFITMKSGVARLSDATQLVSNLGGPFLPLTAGSPSPLVNGLYLASSGLVTRNSTTGGTNAVYDLRFNTGGSTYFGNEGSTGGAIFAGSTPYASVLGNASNVPIQFYTNSALRYTLDGSGNNTWTGSGTFGSDLHLNKATDVGIYTQKSGGKQWFTGSETNNWYLQNVTDGVYPLSISSSLATLSVPLTGTSATFSRNTADALAGIFENTSSTGYGIKTRGGNGTRYSFLVTDYLDNTLLNISTTNGAVFGTSLTGTSASFSGNISFPTSSTVTGNATEFGYNSTFGAYILGKAGTSNDFSLFNTAGSLVMAVPTGTFNVSFSGQVAAPSAVFNSTNGGNISFQTGGSTTSVLTTTNVLTGAGSTTDLNAYVYGNNAYGIWTNGIKGYTMDGSQNNTWTGAGNFGKGVAWGAGSYNPSSLYNDANNGAVLASKTGATNDFLLVNGVGSSVLQNPTGTQNIILSGSLTGTSVKLGVNVNIDRLSNTNSNPVLWSTNGTSDWFLGSSPTGAATSDLSLYSYGTASSILTFERATGNAAFTGTVKTGIGSGETVPSGGLDVGGDIGVTSGKGFVWGGARRITFDIATLNFSTPISGTIAGFSGSLSAASAMFSSSGTTTAPSLGVGSSTVGFSQPTTNTLSSIVNSLEVGKYSSASGFGTFFHASSTGSFFYGAQAGHSFESNRSWPTTSFVNTAASGPNGIQIRFTASAPNNNTINFIEALDNSGTKFKVYSNGGIANYSANDLNLSDERAKKNITKAGSYWDDIKAIEFDNYQYKDTKESRLLLGVMAQQVEKIRPEWVSNSGGFGKAQDGTNLKSVYEHQLQYGVNIVVQESQKRIEALEEKVRALENKNK